MEVSGEFRIFAFEKQCRRHYNKVKRMKKLLLIAMGAVAGILAERKYKVSDRAEEAWDKFKTQGSTIGKFVEDPDEINPEDEEELTPCCDDL